MGGMCVYSILRTRRERVSSVTEMNERCIENVLKCVERVLKVFQDWQKNVRGRAECMLKERTAEVAYRKQWISESTLMH